ncbi:ATP-binding protein [Lederbergia sp. NSJ-179]|uniref:ATP-binding protein n=1 Tax=Lederbergia sp. NSJ-179 TaxID=2931402 RepID=UPI001FD0133B|nr:ATP-binding protein [Lederbergia sp. NSJ-179]MCJ7843626.1 ATP-binding protein [Lederbergia sp. NSJ-179]
MISIVNMKYDNMMRMTKHLDEKKYYSDEPDVLTFQFTSLNFIEPAGAIILLSTIDRLREDAIPYEIEPIDNINRDAISYGKTMGIFQKLGISDAHSFSQGSNYIAPTKVVLADLFDSLDFQGKTIETYYDEVSTKIVKKILRDLGMGSNDVVRDLFEFVVREMIRNIFDHSQTTHFYYGSQLYPTTNSVELVIADLGLGLLKTIPFDIEETWFGEPTHEDAIRKAVIPGLSALSNHAYAPEDYKNSGYGLALVKRIVERTNGHFSIASGKKTITYSLSGESVEDCDIKGTLIRMRINLDKLNTIDFDEILEDAKKEASSKGYSSSPSSASQKVKSQRV